MLHLGPYISEGRRPLFEVAPPSAPPPDKPLPLPPLPKPEWLVDDWSERPRSFAERVAEPPEERGRFLIPGKPVSPKALRHVERDVAPPGPTRAPPMPPRSSIHSLTDSDDSSELSIGGLQDRIQNATAGLILGRRYMPHVSVTNPGDRSYYAAYLDACETSVHTTSGGSSNRPGHMSGTTAVDSEQPASLNGEPGNWEPDPISAWSDDEDDEEDEKVSIKEIDPNAFGRKKYRHMREGTEGWDGYVQQMLDESRGHKKKDLPRSKPKFLRRLSAMTDADLDRFAARGMRKSR